MFFCRPAALAAGLFLATQASAQDVTADTVVATVNGNDITVGHMIVAKSSLPDQYRQLPDDMLFEGLLEQLIQQAAVASDVDGLSKAGQYALDNERRVLLVGEAVRAATQDAVTEEALQAAYDAQYTEGTAEVEFNASHILVETEELAAEIKAEIEGGADFAQMARDHSTGPSGPNGGELGWFGKGMMVSEFEEAVVAMAAGDVAGPVQTQFGWHVIKLNETRQKDAPTLDEVRGTLAQEIQRGAIETLISGATDGAEITRADAGTIPASVLSDASLLDQ
ncbi:peptidylprolyl isomerase [Ovoidimarina sediminis]|uniref:peptidylprolyl isomerase n=1 Tax=Ovoidimarina sediminis TaxID=3079856 RepID=UPI002907F097|nr:peptidylprolyl isomerase [Rhodophyticola sp. MJ-SS7]MDU8942413.1 peptidylprolyl isomerase [Rhodophyticola sp. MJ-SS7]